MSDDLAEEGAVFDTREDAGKGERGVVRLWLEAIALADKEEEDWRKRATEVVKQYRDEEERKGKQFPILYSNTETIIPAIYNSVPNPDVRRRFGEKDETAKTISQVTERTISYMIDEYDFDSVMNGVVQDMVLPGRGVARVRYQPTFDGEGEAVVSEATTCELVEWDNFRVGPAKVWDKVPWIAYRHFLTREQATALNEKIGATIPLDHTIDGYVDKDGEKSGPPEVFKRLLVWEIWDKEKREVLFIAPSYKDAPLKKEKDLLGLKDFFDCPRPIYAIKTSESLKPIELYRMYKDQAEELDRITRRIMALTGVLKARGIYAAPFADAFSQLSSAEDGDFVASEEIEAFAQNAGGLANAIWHWPLETIIAVLKELYLNREQVKQVIYEITGIADIMRGSTNASETLGAQQIKAQWGSLRIQRMQGEVQRFARDLIRIMAEIVCEKFSPETLTAITAIQVTPEMMEVMKSDLMRSYRIDIETDSTIRADVVRAQEQISQFIQGTGAFFQSVGPAVQSGSMPKDVAIDLYASFSRVFKLGRQAEDALERWAEMGRQEGQNPQQQGPSPEAIAAQQQAMQAQSEMQLKAQETQAKVQESQARLQLEAMTAQAGAALEEKKLAFAMQEHQDKMAIESAKSVNETRALDLKAQEIALKQRELMAKTSLEAAKVLDAKEARQEVMGEDEQVRMA